MLSDEEGRQNFLRMVSMLSNAKDNISDNEPSAPDAETQKEGFDASDTSSGSQKADDKTSALFAALPQLLSALSGSGDTLDSKRVNLIRAISPYLSEERGEYIARAIRMASVAKATKDTLGVLGR